MSSQQKSPVTLIGMRLEERRWRLMRFGRGKKNSGVKDLGSSGLNGVTGTRSFFMPLQFKGGRGTDFKE